METITTKKRRPVVHFPAELERQKFIGKLYGYFHSDSNEYNVVAYGEALKTTLPIIGHVVSEKRDLSETSDELIGVWQDDKLIFQQGQRRCKGNPYELLLNIFSRNSGILETGIMLNKAVIISGCGSVGSLVALELARAGVGNFLLIDNDTMAYHNICRHQCGTSDVGKFKVNAVRERLSQINPSAQVLTQSTILEEVPENVFEKFCEKGAVIVGCADNREGDFYANKISCLFNIPFVSIGFWERAFAGEIFYSIPSKTPCYQCLFGDSENRISQRVSVNRRVYTFEEDIAQTRFEPGISTDINFITTIGIKLILDLLNLDTPDYIPRLVNHLSQFSLICNTNDSQIGGEQAEIFAYPLQVTTSIQVDSDENCPICQLKS